MSIDIQLKRLQKIKDAASNKEAVNKVIARGVENLVKSHFAEVSSKEKNRFGAKSSFWRRMREQVKSYSDAAFAYVSMNRAIAQRYFGGTIKPTGTKRYLTIPLSKQSYGKSAEFFGPDLEVYTSHLGNKFLVMETKKRGKKVLEFLYLLKERVTQRGNKAVLPTKQQFQTAMAEAFQKYMDAKTR